MSGPRKLATGTLAAALALWGASVAAAPAPSLPDLERDEPRELPNAVEALIVKKEGEVRSARAEGIKLLEQFLADSADSPETAEALFKLAELTWEDAQDSYLGRMGRYQDQVAACKKDRRRCPELPGRPPRLELSRSTSTYQRLIKDYPRFRKLDTVIYLYAFSLRDQGKNAEAVAMFERLLADYPRSRFRPDAYMAVAEHRFYEQQDFNGAKRYYKKVLDYPGSPLTGLALFQTAFCAWKMGQTEEAATRWKAVLDLGQKAKGGSREEEKRAAELSDQALEYLVELFTEDDSKTAADAHAFLAQIGGKAYSARVMRRFADTVYDQARYERAAEAYRFLIDQDPKSADAPEFQRKVVDSYLALGRADRAGAEMRRLALDFGPRSEWAKAHADRPKLLAETRTAAESFMRTQAKGLHAQAQRNEKESRIVDKRLYAQAAESYAFYLEQFPDAKDALEIRYLRADILAFKLGDQRAAGHEYLAVGRAKPVGPTHKDALLAAMNAFEKLRRPTGERGPGGKRAVTDDDRRFAEAADLYATLFPNDKEIVTVIYKNGQFFYDHGDYDEAVKRFGLIIEQHPDSPTAALAGDRLLESLGEAKDWANIESWSRRLKKTRAFAARKEQARLDGLIAGAMLKQAEELAGKKQYPEAAEMFRKVGLQFPTHPEAATAWNNAGAAAEKAGRPQEAVAAYRALAERHPRHAQAPTALFTAARIEESIAGYARAAALYETLARKYPQAPDAPTALRQAGLMRQTLGQQDKATALYGEFERQYKDRPEAAAVLFQKGLAQNERKDWKGAAATFGQYASAHGRNATSVEALVHRSEAQLALGDDGAAKESLGRALALHRSLRKSGETGEAAAQARYLQGELVYREYERVKIAGRPRQLRRALEEKAKLLDDARRVYLDVPSYRSPEWATAALLRVGQAYEGFARAMRKAEVPRELGAEEKRMYREELERQVVIIEDKALEAYKTGYAKAMDIGIYNRHTRALRLALSELAGREFPKEVEARPALRPGELRVALEPIEDIRRVIERGRVPVWLLLAVAGLGGAACASKGPAVGEGSGKIVAKVLPAAKPEGRVHFEEGLRLMARGPGSSEAAREAFLRSTKADPQLFEAWHDLGLVESRQGRYDEAVKSLARALSLQPASRRTAVAFGDALVRAGRAGDAADLFRKRVEAAPDDGEMRLLYIQALREAGKNERALEEAAALLLRDSRNVRGFNALGLVYHRQGKHALAEAALKRALELDPDNADVWNNLGLVAMARGHDRQAFEAWGKASTLDPESVAATLNKAAVLLDCGDYKRARAALQDAARVRPEDPEVQVALGVALRGLEQHADARAAYERALALRADYPPALFNLGVLYMDFLPDKRKARQHLTLYRKLAPARDPRSKEAEARLRELK